MVRTRMVGRYTVRMAFKILLLRTKVILTPSSQLVSLMYVSVLK